MNKLRKKLALILSLIVTLIPTIPVSAQEETMIAYVASEEYIITATDVSEELRVSPDRESSKTINVSIRYDDGSLMAQYQVTFKGLWSMTDRMSEMTSVTVTPISVNQQGISYQTNVSGQNGRAVFYLYGKYLATASGNIALNGTITTNFGA